MNRLLVSVVAVAAMALAAGKSYTVKLYSPAMVGHTELKPGEYEVKVENDKAFIRGYNVKAEAGVKVETVDSKYPTTTVRIGTGDKTQIQEIRIAGTKTKLVFGDAAATAGM